MEKKSYGGGMSAGTLLQVALIIMKLSGVISWSWVWVLAPLWIGFGIVVLLLSALLIVKKVKGL